MGVIDAEDTGKSLISQDFKHITFLSDYNFVCRNTPQISKASAWKFWDLRGAIKQV